MLALSLLVACSPTIDSTPLALALPGEVQHEYVTVTDDGRDLVIEEVERPFASAFLIVIVLCCFLMTPWCLVVLWDDGPVVAIIVSGVLFAAGVGLGWAGAQNRTLHLSRSEQVIHLHKRWLIGPDLQQTTVPFGDVARLGVYLQRSDGYVPIVFHFTTYDDTRYTMTVSREDADDAVPFAEGLRDHIAEVVGVTEVEPTAWRWW